MISIWEQESFLKYDIIIIGAGISGLSTAATLKEKHPKLNVLVLERGLLPTGASTKNAGFACFGSISELAQDRKSLGDDGMINLVKKRWNGLQKTTFRLGENNIGLEKKGGFELIDNNDEHYLDAIPETNQLLKDVFPEDVFSIQSSKLDSFGFGKTKQLINNRYEGQLNTGYLIKSLWQYCNEKGVKIITGAEVIGFKELENEVTVKTKSQLFVCDKLALCTNAFTQTLTDIPSNLIPGRGMVLLIQPKSKLTFEGSFHFKEGYYYFRDYHGKLIFGGGRDLDFQNEQTTSFGINEKIESQLHNYLQEIIIPNCEYITQMKWSGIMAFGDNKSPFVSSISDRVFAGVRLGGMGVAIGSIVGEELADLILESNTH